MLFDTWNTLIASKFYQENHFEASSENVVFYEKWWFFLEKIKIFENFQKTWKNRKFEKIHQTSNCSKNRNFWAMTKQKNCNEIFYQRLHFHKFFWRTRTSARGARQNPLCWETLENHRFLALMAEYSTGARGSARAPEIFSPSDSSWNLLPPRYPERIDISWIGCCRWLWTMFRFGTKKEHFRERKTRLL